MPIVKWNRAAKRFEKQCSKCEAVLPATAEYFHRGAKYADGLIPQCKTCKSAVNRDWRLRNPDYKKVYDRAGRDREYRMLNRAKRADAKRRYNAANRERLAAYRKAHPAPASAYQRTERRSAKDREYNRLVRSVVTKSDRAAAGKDYRRYVEVGARTGRLIGRRGDMWLVLLHDPIKVGPDEIQRVIQTRDIKFIDTKEGC